MPKLLTGDVNAAVEVIVWDGQGSADNLSADTIHPKAKLIMGGLPATSTLERKYTAIAFVGQHGMANVPHAIMAHSYSPLGIQTMKLNGKPVGEIDTRGALAGQELIREAARKSMSKIGKIKPYSVPGPVTLEIEYTTRGSLNPDAAKIPHAKLLGDRTIQITGQNIVEVWTRYRTSR